MVSRAKDYFFAAFCRKRLDPCFVDSDLVGSDRVDSNED